MTAKPTFLLHSTHAMSLAPNRISAIRWHLAAQLLPKSCGRIAVCVMIAHGILAGGGPSEDRNADHDR